MKVTVIGNAAGGKSTLSRRLAELHKLPLTHVDSLQFESGLRIRPHRETMADLCKIESGTRWLIDGYGPLDILEARLAMVDHIVFVDMPIAQHYWWFAKRQVQNLWSPRPELPPNCRETTWHHTTKVLKSLWQVHTQMRPEMLRILARPAHHSKLIHIRSLQDWNRVHREGICANDKSPQQKKPRLP